MAKSTERTKRLTQTRRLSRKESGFFRRFNINTHHFVLGLVLVVTVFSLFFYKPQLSLGTEYSFTQTDWRGGLAPLTTLAPLSGWTKYFEATPDIDAGLNVQLKETTAWLTHNSTADFGAPAVHNNTMEVGGNLLLNRAGDPSGIVTLDTVTNNGDQASSIVKDQNNGLHIIYHNHGGGANQKLKYKYSGNGGQTWSAPVYIPAASVSSPTDYGNYNDLVVDTANNRLYAIYRAHKNSSYAAMLIASCDYPAGGGQCGAWNDGRVSYFDGSSSPKKAYNYKYPTAVLQGSTLHVAYMLSSTFGYKKCDVSSTQDCVSAGWSSEVKPNWDYAVSPKLLASNGYLYLFTFADPRLDSLNLILRYRSCKISDCMIAGKWSNVKIAANQNGQPWLDAVLNGSAVNLIYDNGSSDLKYISGTLSGGSISWSSTETITNGLVTGSRARISLDNSNKPYVVFKKADGINWARRITTGSSCGTSASTSWKCGSIESGGDGTALTLLPGDMPAIIHYNGNNVRYLSTPYASSGTFTSKRFNAGSNDATWKTLKVTLAEALPADTGFTVSAGSSNSSSALISHCFLIKPTPVNNVYTFDLTEPTTYQNSSCGWVQPNTRYFEYQISMTSNTTKSQSPVISEVKAEYRTFPQSASLTSSPHQMGTASDLPAVKSVSWTEIIPAGSTARVKLQVRTKAVNTFGASDPWYGAGTAAGGYFLSTDTIVDGSCVRTLISGSLKSVTCDFDPNNPVYKDGNPYAQYRITLESPAQDVTASVEDVTITYAINDPPNVTGVTALQSADGTVMVNYTVNDNDPSNTNFNVALFYDLGLTLAADPGVNGTTINLDVPNNDDLTLLIPSEGTLLIDNEQIKYYYVGGSFVKGTTIPSRPLARAAYGTVASSHSAGVKIWVRATDAIQAADFSRITYATGSVGGGVTSGPHTISWRATDDMIASVYLINATIKVIANDGEPIRPVGGGESALFTLDTKSPVIGVNALDITGVGVSTTTTGFKSSTQTVTLSVALPDTTSDNSVTEDYLSVCNKAISSSCGTPSGIDLLNGTTSGWSLKTQFNITKAWTLLNTETELQNVKAAVFDSKGNVSFAVKSIVFDKTAPPQPQNFSVENVTNDNIGPSIYLRWDVLDWNTPTDKHDGYGQIDFKQFQIYRATGTSPTDSDYALLTTLPNATATSYVDAANDLVLGTTFFYKIIALDNLDNTTDTIATAPTGSALVESMGSVEPPPPVIKNVSPGAITQTSIELTWDTKVASDSRVAYVPDAFPQGGDFSTAPTQGNSTLVDIGHSVVVVGLEPSTTYYFELRSTAAGGTTPGVLSQNLGQSINYTTTDPPPIITPFIEPTSVAESNITHTSATISWTTDVASDSFIEYGTQTTLGSYYGQSESVKNHTVPLPNGLTPNTIYYYRLHSAAAGVDGVHPSVGATPRDFKTNPDPQDTTPPIITNVQAINVQYNTAVITWQTSNEPSSSYVEFWSAEDMSDIRIWPVVSPAFDVNHSVQLPLNLQPSTIYTFHVRSADSSNNSRLSLDKTFLTLDDPGVIPDPEIKNIQHDPPTATNVTIRWTTDVVSDSVVIFSEDSSSIGQTQSYGLFELDHEITLVNLSPGKQYYYFVKSTNLSGGFSIDPKTGPGRVFTTLISDSPVPEIVSGSIQVTDIQPFQVTIEWQTTQPGNSLIEFGTATDDAGLPLYGRTFGKINDNVSNHVVQLPNDLLENQLYHFRIHTMDANKQEVVHPGVPNPGDVACQNDAINCLDPTFTTGAANFEYVSETKQKPVISSVGPLLVTDTTAIIGWTTDKPADSSLEYDVSTSYGIEITDSTLTRTHTIKINKLQATTIYYFKVSSADINGRLSPDDNKGKGYTFETKPTPKTGEGDLNQYQYDPGDKTPPSVYDVSVSDITKNGATITWITNEEATSIVQYGKTIIYGDLDGDYSTFTSAHKVILAGLSAGTEYYFQAISYDASGNRGQGQGQTFKTTGVLGEDKKDQIDDTETEGDQKEGEKNKKGKDELNDMEKRIRELSAEKKLSLESILELLDGFSEKDAARILETVGLQLVSPPKFVGGEPIVVVTTDSATISWQTDRDSDSRVAYADTDNYQPNSDNPYTIETGDTQIFTKEHIVELVNLEPNTLYYYQLRSRERVGRTARSKHKTFRTLPLRPEIKKLGVQSVTENTATLTWKTNVPTKSVLAYTNLSTDEERSQGDPQFLTIHTFTLRGLTGDTPYQLVISGEDETGLTVTSRAVTFRTVRDDIPPEISQVRTEVSLSAGAAKFAQAIITWKTDEPSTSQVAFEEGITQRTELANASALSSELLLNHVVILNRLRPATVYRFRVLSQDKIGNLSESRDYTLLTPQKKQTVLEIIVKNFEETFGFLRLFGQ